MGVLKDRAHEQGISNFKGLKKVCFRDFKAVLFTPRFGGNHSVFSWTLIRDFPGGPFSISTFLTFRTRGFLGLPSWRGPFLWAIGGASPGGLKGFPLFWGAVFYFGPLLGKLGFLEKSFGPLCVLQYLCLPRVGATPEEGFYLGGV